MREKKSNWDNRPLRETQKHHACVKAHALRTLLGRMISARSGNLEDDEFVKGQVVYMNRFHLWYLDHLDELKDRAPEEPV